MSFDELSIKLDIHNVHYLKMITEIDFKFDRPEMDCIFPRIRSVYFHNKNPLAYYYVLVLRHLISFQPARFMLYDNSDNAYSFHIEEKDGTERLIFKKDGFPILMTTSLDIDKIDGREFVNTI